jgi:hypothetical protein
MTEHDKFDRLHEWVLSLPWVVERPRDPDAPDTRTFAVDCGPLGYRSIWLVTGLHSDTDCGDTGLAVVLPLDAASTATADGEACGVAFLPGGYVLVSPSTGPANHPLQVERLLLSAYGHAMSAPSTTDIA